MPAAVESFVPPCTGPLITQSLGKVLPQFKGQVAAFHDLRGAKVVFGNVASLSPKVRSYVEENVALCKPDAVHICDGSPAEGANLLKLMLSTGAIKALPKYDNCWLARTNPKDVARVESRTFICSDEPNEVVPRVINGKSKLGNWISPKDYANAVSERFPGCMKGRTMYVIPYSMGPVGSSLSKIGIECTDSAYVVYSMVIMTRVGTKILDLLKKDDAEFVRCLHSVGTPASGIVEMPNWPCDPERTIILHKPKHNEIVSYGSGYGGNSLLGKKCFALRIGSTIANREGWLAEHMVILGITNKDGEKKYMAAAFPSACGKTNLAMMLPSLPGYKLECVGDDIAWMKFDESGQLRAINPENGFFGVAPGTSQETNPNAMATIFKNTIFTNVAETSDGGVYWEGMSAPPKDVQIKDWTGKPWDMETAKTPAAHPNSRFCSPATQCPTIDPAWESSAGVPISAILFGGRRPQGVPLIYQARDWNHGVFVGASMRSETTAAAEFSGKAIMHDPFAMRPFFGYNFGHYISHWLSMADKTTADKLPKIFHVNWFRKSTKGKFLWPGFGDNCRVLDWIMRRCDDEDCYQDSPIGLLPKENSINFEGLSERINTEELFDVPKDFWLQEAEDIDKYFTEQVGEDLPSEIRQQLDELRSRLQKA